MKIPKIKAQKNMMPKASAKAPPAATPKPRPMMRGNAVAPPDMAKMATPKPTKNTPTLETFKKGMKRGK